MVVPAEPAASRTLEWPARVAIVARVAKEAGAEAAEAMVWPAPDRLTLVRTATPVLEAAPVEGVVQEEAGAPQGVVRGRVPVRSSRAKRQPSLSARW
jgi:hypothetical protein